MKRPLAYITAGWLGGDSENAEQAARYCRAVYEAGFSPICPNTKQDNNEQAEPSQYSLTHISALTSLLFRPAMRHDSAELLEQTKSA